MLQTIEKLLTTNVKKVHTTIITYVNLCRHLSNKVLFYIVILEGDCIDHAFTVRWLRNTSAPGPWDFPRTSIP